MIITICGRIAAQNGIMSNERIFITGASRGLGKSLFSHCINNNITVFSHSRDQGADVCGDITSVHTQNNIIEFIKKNNVNVLINNAGVYLRQVADETADESIEQLIYTNLIAPLKLTCKTLRVFKAGSGGKIYNIGSIAGIMPSKYESIYCASKFGLRGFTDSIKEEIKEYNNISIFNVVLGGMKTDICKERDSYNELADPDEVADYIIKHIKSSYESIETDLVIRRKMK